MTKLQTLKQETKGKASCMLSARGWLTRANFGHIFYKNEHRVKFMTNQIRFDHRSPHGWYKLDSISYIAAAENMKRGYLIQSVIGMIP